MSWLKEDHGREFDVTSALAIHRNKAIVVGAGMGGLACAISLACRGLEVLVLEAADGPGGKMRPRIVAGHAVDSGPTVFTMRWVFEQLFEAAGAVFSERVPCQKLDVLARHAWRNGDGYFDLLADRAAGLDAVAAFAGPEEARRFQAFCSEAASLYRHLEMPYIRSERPTLGSMVRDLGPGGLAALMGLGPFSTLWRTLGRRFRDPRLRQLFARYATYCGSSPWLAPATLMLIAQVELDGVWAVEGGMSRLAQAIEDLALQRGVTIEYGAQVSDIVVEADRTRGVRLQDGREIRADAVVFNGDVQALASHHVGGAGAAVLPEPASQRSLSAMTWSMVAPTEGFDLARHNVFFDVDYNSEFDDIFGHGRMPRRPTVYLCAHDRLNGNRGEVALHEGWEVEPGHPERLLALVNAPACGDRGSQTDVDRASEIALCEQSAFRMLQSCGLTVNLERGEVHRTTPWDFEKRFPATGGGLYGMATHGWMASFRRPSSRTALPGLFLAGGSAHPGPGVPMATMSGRLAAEAVMAHLDSTSRSSRVVIAGGISMHSATMANTA